MEKKSILKIETLKKTLKIIGDVLLYIIIIFALFVLIISITSKKDSDGTSTVFGKQLRFVQSNSMAECELTDVSGYKIKSIPVKSCVFIEVAPENEQEKAEWYKGLKVGDVLTFKYVYTKQETITHRIVNIVENESGGYLITLQGDNKNLDSNLLSQTINTSLSDSPNYIIGKVTGQSYLLGVLVYAFKTPVGIICFVIIPCLIIIVFEVMRLIRVFGKDKKEKLKAEQEKQANEIEELKRQLAALQSNAGSSQNQAEPTAEQTQGEASGSEKSSQSKTARKPTAKAGTSARKKTTIAEQTQDETSVSEKSSQSKTTRKPTAKAGTSARKKTTTAEQVQDKTSVSEKSRRVKRREKRPQKRERAREKRQPLRSKCKTRRA